MAHLGFAIAQNEAEKKSRYLSFHDSLTGLYNRAYFEEEMKRLDRERQLPISVIMGDVNGLKLVNDGLGHSAGDEILRQTARVLKGACRAEDVIARWGGDEFVILLPHAPENAAKSVCSRITEACRGIRMGPVGLSIALGYATKTEPRQRLKDTLDKAENWLYQRKLLEGKSQRSDIISSLDSALREKSHETEEHVKRITDMAIRIGKVLGLSDSDLNGLELLARLHDIGKIGVPDIILNKPGQLSKDEWIVMKKHPEIGYRIAVALPDLASIGESILAHHERWDGKGYPRGLRNEEIPLLARIIAVVDAYDVMTRGRPYMPAVSCDKALDEICRNSATQFDPQVVQAFMQMKEAAISTT
jgi:diguanylate cyclase (GGDEF)-like protein